MSAAVHHLVGWWHDVHKHPELPKTKQNLRHVPSPPFPKLLEIIGFVLLCILVPIVVGKICDYLLIGSSIHHHIRHFLIWFLMLIIEFAYVNHIVTRRPSWFLSRHGDSRDIWTIIILSIFCYFGGAFLTQPETGLFTGESFWIDGLYVAWFLLFSHASYIHRLPHEFYASLNPQDIAKTSSTYRTLLVLSLRVGPTGYLIILRFKHMFLHEPLYFFIHMGVLVILLWITWLVTDTHYPHIHHYFIGLFFVFSSGYYANQNVSSIIPYAISSASFVEGAARWSCAPLWHTRHH